MKAKLSLSSSDINKISLKDRFSLFRLINIRPKTKTHETSASTRLPKNVKAIDSNLSLNTESEKFLNSCEEHGTVTIDNEITKSVKLQNKSGIIKNKDKNNVKCADLRRCYKLFFTSSSADEIEKRPPSPVLPMVKFDSTDDFAKEPFERKRFNMLNYF